MITVHHFFTYCMPTARRVCYYLLSDCARQLNAGLPGIFARELSTVQIRHRQSFCQFRKEISYIEPRIFRVISDHYVARAVLQIEMINCFKKETNIFLIEPKRNKCVYNK